jgi:tetratricopeptide (TPR) repeat protein
MCRLLSAFVIALLVSCSNDRPAGDPVLDTEPYASLTDSIRRFPGNADLYYRRAGRLFEAGERQAALSDIRVAWRILPNEPIALRYAGMLRQVHEDSALQFLELAHQQLDRSIAVQVALARGYQKKGLADRALAVCDSIIGRYPNQLDALVLKSEILSAQKKDAESLTTLEQAYTYAPFDADIAHNLAFAYATAGNPRALALSDSLIAKDPSGRHAEPYYFKGLYYETVGNEMKAIALFDEAVRHDYNFLDAHMEKGQVQFDARQFDAALRSYQLAATISPTFADAYFGVARSLEAMGNKADAKLNYQRAYSLDKSMTEARDAAARL